MVKAISLAVRALNEYKYIQTHKNLVFPLLMYYQLNNEAHIINIDKMNLTLTNTSFDSYRVVT